MLERAIRIAFLAAGAIVLAAPLAHADSHNRAVDPGYSHHNHGSTGTTVDNSSESKCPCSQDPGDADTWGNEPHGSKGGGGGKGGAGGGHISDDEGPDHYHGYSPQ
ncbi:hypothetical protein [Nocardia sp. NPDC020380]|uniref:hypothetical protein n=1 Tax=Nocardia sp. NPDC020380 TaxID=3364309 RepID=UPI0037B4631A